VIYRCSVYLRVIPRLHVAWFFTQLGVNDNR